jgi:uncharacterized protein (TIGR00106 family)
MYVLAELCVLPLGVGVSVSEYVAECQQVFKQAKLSHSLHAFGTNIEGEWEEVMAAVKCCHERLHALGVPRIHTSLTLATRLDKQQSLRQKIDSVRALEQK